jgi:hypothetical protein
LEHKPSAQYGRRKKAFEQAEAALKMYEKVEAPNAQDVRQQLVQWQKP